MMNVYRTPDSCFENLPDYDFEPHYLMIKDDNGTELRVHYVDEGPQDAEPILLMHGNPAWVYLYRHMIPGLLTSGRRVIAVDLIGCGRSDKPAKQSDYTQARHVAWMEKWLLALDLQNITLFCQDWGGVIGLNLVANHPERFDRVIAANTGLPSGKGGNRALRMWQRIMKIIPLFPMRFALKPAMQREDFSDAEFRAYLAPYPGRKYQAGILSFTQLISVFPDNPGAQQNRVALEKLKQFDKPFLTLFGTRDPMSKGGEKVLQKYIPGAKGQNHKLIRGAGHFIQDDKPDEMVAETLLFLEVAGQEKRENE